MNKDIKITKTFWGWVKNPSLEEVKYHLYQINYFIDPPLITLPHDTYLCGMKVNNKHDLHDYDWLEMMRGGFEPYEDKFCKLCMEKYKSSKK